MKTHTPLYNGEVIPFETQPFTLARKEATSIESSLRELLKQVEDFTTQALKDKKLLRILGVNEEMSPNPTPLGMHIPFARFDFAYDASGKPFVFELNTDGTSSWNIAEFANTQAEIPEKQNPNLNLSQRLLEGLLLHAPKAKSVTMVDFNDVATVWEQKDLCEKWSKKIPCSMKSPTEKNWNKESLIYRRAVSWDLKLRSKECSEFLNEWKSEHITVVGGWSSDIGMSKVWPAFVKNPLMAETVVLNDYSVKIKNQKNDWVIKKAFSHSGRGVVRGLDVDHAKWQELIDSKQYHIAQHFVQMRGKNNADKLGGVELGLYFINSKTAGYLCRTGHKGMITDTSSDLVTPIQITD